MIDEEQDPLWPEREEPSGYFPGSGQHYLGSSPSNPDPNDIVPDVDRPPFTENDRRRLREEIAKAKAAGLLEDGDTPMGRLPRLRQHSPPPPRRRPRFRWPWQRRSK